MAQENKTKVVIRKLPPYLKQEGFLEAVNKNFEGAYDWCSYYPGKLSHRRLVHSRAYLNFKKPELVYDFHESFDGHVFVNEKGVQFRAEVEYAPYQKIPKGRNKKDLREGTIFEDPDYLSFLAELENPKPSVSVTDAQKEEAERAAAKGPIITPLIQYIREKRASKAAGREKVGPRPSSREGARKAASAAISGSASGKAAKNGSSEKGVLDRKGVGKDDSSRRSSSRTDGKSRRDSSSASEADKNEASSQKAPRPSPRDPSGILKRPSTPENETAPPSSDRRKEASGRGGPEKRIVKGALASIIGGGLGRPPRGSRDADIRRKDRSVPEPSPLPAEPSGWGDVPDSKATDADGLAGPSGDWGTDNPLAGKGAKPGNEAGGRKEGASRRGGSRSRSAGGRNEGESQATGWDDVSEGLLKAPAAGGSEPQREGPRGKSGSQERAPSGGSSKRGQQVTSAGAAPQVTLLQRDKGAFGSGAADGSRADSHLPGGQLAINRSGGNGSSNGSSVNRLSGSNVGDSQDGTNSSPLTVQSGGRGQQTGSRTGDEGTARGGGRGSRRRGQGRGQAPETNPDANAAAKAAWAAMSGIPPAKTSAVPPTLPARPDEPTSARPTWQPRDPARGQNDVIRVSEAGGSGVRVMQRSGGTSAPVSQGALSQSTGSLANGLAGSGEAPVSQQSTAPMSRTQPRPGRQPRHQGPYQPGGRGSNRGGMLRQGESTEGPNGAVQAGVSNWGMGAESELDGGQIRDGGAAGLNSAEAAAAKKQMWVAVQKPG